MGLLMASDSKRARVKLRDGSDVMGYGEVVVEGENLLHVISVP